MKGLGRITIWTGLAVLVGLALWRAFTPAPILVEVASVRRGALEITVDDDGRTRVRDRFTISAPILGTLLRTPLRAGDVVHANETVVAEFLPSASSPLDPRTHAEAEAKLAAAEAAVEQAEANRARAEADLQYARATYERSHDLYAKRVVPKEELDAAERDRAAAEAALRAAESAHHVAQHDVEVARAVLRGGGNSTGNSADARMLLRSPIDGKVLRIHEESARTLPAGTPILDVGDVGKIEIIAEYLTQDAVRVRPGMDVVFEGWSVDIGSPNDLTLHGRVRVVEPGGFTKISALGVEEQRVNIVIDPAGDPQHWAAIGDGYRMETRIVLWRNEDVVVVPTGALFRDGDAWAVFVVEAGRARRRSVTLGHTGGLEAEVLEGLVASETVIMYPSELVDQGARVEVRGAG
jgi:HlyD family secretion protein